MRTLEGDKKVSWFETPELEEQQHSSRVTCVLPPKRRNHPDQVFLNLQAKWLEEAQGGWFLSLIEWGPFWQHQTSLTPPIRGINQTLTKNIWPEDELCYPTGPETLLSNQKYWGRRAEQQESRSYCKWTNPGSHFSSAGLSCFWLARRHRSKQAEPQGCVAPTSGPFQEASLSPCVWNAPLLPRDTEAAWNSGGRFSPNRSPTERHLRPSLEQLLPPLQAVVWMKGSDKSSRPK